MKTQLILLIITILVLVSAAACIFEYDTYRIDVRFAERSPWEHALKSPVWYTVRYLDEYGVKTVYLPEDADGCTLEIPKGLPCIAAAYPLGSYAPLGVCIDPDEEGECCSFTSKAGDVADSLLRYHTEFADLLGSIDYPDLVDTVWESTDGRPWAADWGELYFQLLFGGGVPDEVALKEVFPVRVPDIIPGHWIADCRGVPVATASALGRTAYLKLPEGIYTLINPECRDYVVRLEVEEDGDFRSSRRPFPVGL